MYSNLNSFPSQINTLADIITRLSADNRTVGPDIQQNGIHISPPVAHTMMSKRTTPAASIVDYNEQVVHDETGRTLLPQHCFNGMDQSKHCHGFLQVQ